MSDENLNKKENFLEVMSDELMKIHTDLNEIRMFTRESLNYDRVDEILEVIDSLAGYAESVGDGAKTRMLRSLSVHFYLLNTFSDDSEKFTEAAANAFTLLETVLLALDGSVSKTRGQIVEIIEKRAE